MLLGPLIVDLEYLVREFEVKYLRSNFFSPDTSLLRSAVLHYSTVRTDHCNSLLAKMPNVSGILVCKRRTSVKQCLRMLCSADRSNDVSGEKNVIKVQRT